MNPNRKLRRFHLSSLLVALAAFTVVGLPALAQQAGTSPVKIFILAGQSNMQGQGEITPVTTPGTLEYIVANDPGTTTSSWSMAGATGWSATTSGSMTSGVGGLRTGDLEPGYGASGANTTIGPELGFGHTVGDPSTTRC